MELQELNKRIQQINPIKAFAEFVSDNPSLFIDALREQMYRGESGDGLIRYIYASEDYEKYKFRKNPKAGGRPDLNNEGDFYAGIEVDVYYTSNQVALNFYSTDSKSDKLTEKYTNTIWILNEKTISLIQKEIKTKFKDYLI